MNFIELKIIISSFFELILLLNSDRRLPGEEQFPLSSSRQRYLSQPCPAPLIMDGEKARMVMVVASRQADGRSCALETRGALGNKGD
jgi:hypothetical protein